MTEPTRAKPDRRHDLDALRGAAMLLGIAYHISLSFAVGFPWMVQDSQQHMGFTVFQNWVHGFRMPLFFILSGFFTAMLWRYRGLGATMNHRFRRIFLPLVVFLIAIIPLTYLSIGYAMSQGKAPKAQEQNQIAPDADLDDLDLFTIIAEGTPDQLRAKLAKGADPNAIEPTIQSTTLSTAAFLGKPEMIDILLDAGANINGRTGDGATALHGAAFLGNADIAQQLIDAGIDIEATNERGESAANSAQAPWMITQMIVNAIGISVDKAEVEAGRLKVLEILANARQRENEIMEKIAMPSSPDPENAVPDSIWEAIEIGNAQAVQSVIDVGLDLNSVNPESNLTPLQTAAAMGRPTIVELLINAGADVNHPSSDGGTALHAAAFFGRFDSAKLLVAAGAKVNAKNERGDTPLSLCKIPWGLSQSFIQMSGIEVDKEALLSGRKQLIALIRETDPSLKKSPLMEFIEGMTNAPITIHLWFLLYLCWLAPLFALYAFIAQATGFRRTPKWLVASPLALLLWIALTMIPQSYMGADFHFFGPDTSSGLIPRPDIFLYYSLFFFFGALYFDANDEEGRLGRSWKLTIPIATFILLPVALGIQSGSIEGIPENSQRPVSILLQAAYAWILSIGFIGLFRAALTKESRLIRYISDSSYWLYVIHMPLVFFAQRFIRDWEMPAIVKFMMLNVVLIAFMLATYHYLVRYTPIGTFLNGKRTRLKGAI